MSKCPGDKRYGKTPHVINSSWKFHKMTRVLHPLKSYGRDICLTSNNLWKFEKFRNKDSQESGIQLQTPALWLLAVQSWGIPNWSSLGLPGGWDRKASACNAGDLGSSLGLGRSPGEGNGTPLQYSCLEIPWTEEPGRLQSMGSQRVGYDWAISLSSRKMVFYSLLVERWICKMVQPLWKIDWQQFPIKLNPDLSYESPVPLGLAALVIMA